MVADVFHGSLKCQNTLHAMSLIEGQVGLISHAIGSCGIDDGLIEGKDRVLQSKQMLRNLLQVGIKSHAKEALAFAYLAHQFLSVHIGSDYICIFALLLRFSVCRHHNSDSFKRSAFSATIRWSMQSCICPSMKAGRLYMV